MPAAVKVTGTPLGVEGAVGLMLMLVIVAAVTDRAAVGEVTPLAEAVMVVLPTATPVATPVALSMEAMLLLADAQVTWLVTSPVLPSLYVAVAVKLVLKPLETFAVAGVMAMLSSVTLAFVGIVVVVDAAVAPPPPPPQAASMNESIRLKIRWMVRFM